MTSWVGTRPDVVATVTPLTAIKEAGPSALAELPSLWTVFMGNIGGSIGETSALLLIIGGIYLVYRGVIKVTIPSVYIGTFGLLTLAYSGFNFNYTLYHLFTGGLMLGAIYMATDYASSPVTKKGQIIFAFGAGLFTFIIRFFGGLPEGVSYSILLMNVATPIIERYTTPTVFGGGK
jgi:electron transport complex protein RnfD